MQSARIEIERAEPVVIAFRRDDHGHAIVDFGHELVGGGGDYGEGTDPFTRHGMLPVLPNGREGEGLARGQPNGERLFGARVLGRTPFEEIVNRQQCVPTLVGVAKRRWRLTRLLRSPV